MNKLKNFIISWLFISVTLFQPITVQAYEAEDGEEGTVYMQEEFLDGDILKISVMLKDIDTPVIGLGFHLKYENIKLDFLRYSPGDFLEKGGDPFYLAKADRERGIIIFGSTLRRDDQFPVGQGTIADFYFQIINDGIYSFEFKNPVLSTLDVVRQDLQNISWKNLICSKKINEENSLVTGTQKGLNQKPISQANAPILILIITGLIVAIWGAVKIFKKYKFLDRIKPKSSKKICQF